MLLSCSAHAVVGLLEYFLQRDIGATFDLSRLFVYQQALLCDPLPLGNRGVSLRIALGTIQKKGVLPEREYRAYALGNLTKAPSPKDEVAAKRYRCGAYFRLDDSKFIARFGREGLLRKVKRVLYSGFPCVFGFEMHPSMPGHDVEGDPLIPYPAKGELPINSHSVVAVGYDNGKEIPIPGSMGVTRGALRIRNSWGPRWGDGGYGWLPYEYLRKGKSFDFWSITGAQFDRSPLIRA